MEIKLLEAEVEDIIFEEQDLEQYSIKCIGRQVAFGKAGIVDILGWDRERKCWVIVEIKRDRLCSKAYAQGMRYRDWLEGQLANRAASRGIGFKKPYTLLIGAELADELNFISDICRGDVSQGGCCYSLFQVEPVLNLNWFSPAQRRYAEHQDKLPTKLL